MSYLTLLLCDDQLPIATFDWKNPQSTSCSHGCDFKETKGSTPLGIRYTRVFLLQNFEGDCLPEPSDTKHGNTNFNLEATKHWEKKGESLTITPPTIQSKFTRKAVLQVPDSLSALFSGPHTFQKITTWLHDLNVKRNELVMNGHCLLWVAKVWKCTLTSYSLVRILELSKKWLARRKKATLVSGTSDVALVKTTWRTAQVRQCNQVRSFGHSRSLPFTLVHSLSLSLSLSPSLSPSLVKNVQSICCFGCAINWGALEIFEATQRLCKPTSGVMDKT